MRMSFFLFLSLLLLPLSALLFSLLSLFCFHPPALSSSPFFDSPPSPPPPTPTLSQLQTVSRKSAAPAARRTAVRVSARYAKGPNRLSRRAGAGGQSHWFSSPWSSSIGLERLLFSAPPLALFLTQLPLCFAAKTTFCNTHFAPSEARSPPLVASGAQNSHECCLSRGCRGGLSAMRRRLAPENGSQKKKRAREPRAGEKAYRFFFSDAAAKRSSSRLFFDLTLFFSFQFFSTNSFTAPSASSSPSRSRPASPPPPAPCSRPRSPPRPRSPLRSRTSSTRSSPAVSCSSPSSSRSLPSPASTRSPASREGERRDGIAFGDLLRNDVI